MYTKNFSEINASHVSEVGGKGASLGEMIRAGIRVPPGFVVTVNAFESFLKLNNLDEHIKELLSQVDIQNNASVEKISASIRNAIAQGVIDKKLETEIVEAVRSLGAKCLAVRSSATAEDSSAASWAGELDTFLNVTEDRVIDRVRQCWSSLYTPRAIFYRIEKNLSQAVVGVAVVVQKMVQSDVSGVVFTVHPVTKNPDELIIEAGYGLGEAVVGGVITPDSYVVNKRSHEIVDVNVSIQTKKLIQNTTGENNWLDLDEAVGGKQKIPNDAILQIANVCTLIESHYGFPCDIEWAIEAGELFITQSRPITTL